MSVKWQSILFLVSCKQTYIFFVGTLYYMILFLQALHVLNWARPHQSLKHRTFPRRLKYCWLADTARRKIRKRNLHTTLRYLYHQRHSQYISSLRLPTPVYLLSSKWSAHSVPESQGRRFDFCQRTFLCLRQLLIDLLYCSVIFLAWKSFQWTGQTSSCFVTWTVYHCLSGIRDFIHCFGIAHFLNFFLRGGV